MQDLFGSVRRSFSFRSNPAGNDGGGSRIVEKIGLRLRKSRVGMGLGLGLSPKPNPSPHPFSPIRWREGELIGCGAFGHVYMGMNLDSGELLAVKQVLIGTSNASKEKAQAHIRELEEEVKLLKSLSHPNIVRYLGTVREEETLNILLEFVPGGSISSLLGKFGSFPEAVIKMYTKQLLQGLEYLHKNGIIHRDIKGANILVDNKGCIKLADFGASKQVAKLATMPAAKSMKGTPYWMAPEVILQIGHTLEPNLRPSASDLLQHPFVAKDFEHSQSVHLSSNTDSLKEVVPVTKSYVKDLGFRDIEHSGSYTEQLSDLRPIWDTKSSDDMCQIFDKDACPKSFNPMSEPLDEWPSKFDAHFLNSMDESSNGENKFTFPCEPTCEEDDYEVTERKSRAFLDEKAIDLKKLQTPLYEEFFNSLSAIPEAFSRKVGNKYEGEAEQTSKDSKRFSNKITNDPTTPIYADNATAGSPTVLNTGLESRPVFREIPSAQLNEWGELLQDSKSEANSPRRKRWKEELDQELQRQREIRQANGVGKFSRRKQDRMLFISPRK